MNSRSTTGNSLTSGISTWRWRSRNWRVFEVLRPRGTEVRVVADIEVDSNGMVRAPTAPAWAPRSTSPDRAEESRHADLDAGDFVRFERRATPRNLLLGEFGRGHSPPGSIRAGEYGVSAAARWTRRARASRARRRCVVGVERGGRGSGSARGAHRAQHERRSASAWAAHHGEAVAGMPAAARPGGRCGRGMRPITDSPHPRRDRWTRARGHVSEERGGLAGVPQGHRVADPHSSRLSTPRRR